jgi:hypothetical protein
MTVQTTCKECLSHMAVLDTLIEGYDLVCTRCGGRERVEYRLIQPIFWQ